MKPYKVFLFVGVILLLVVAALYFQKQCHWNVLEYFRPAIEQNDLGSTLEQAADSLPSEAATIDSTLCRFPYDSINGEIRMASKASFKSLGKRLTRADSLSSAARVLYIGDSQLEGDFLTATLRQELQKKYGGKGPGLIAADQYYSDLHQLLMSTSNHWKQSERMTVCEGNKSLLFRHASLPKGGQSAWLKINRINRLGAAADYHQLRLFFVSSDSVEIRFTHREQVVAAYKLSGSEEMRYVQVELEDTPSSLKMEVSTTGYFEIDCLSLDSPQGIHVDNIPVRGKASPLFHISDSTAMRSMCSLLKPDLFILQFGANIIKYANRQTLEVFRRQTIEQVKIIQQWCPKAQILIVSISDIARKTSQGVVSYAEIDSLKAIQYEIAMQHGCAFWDLDYYMSQEGGVVQWASASPALARSDYLHFTKYGARKIGFKLSSLLIRELEK